MKRIAALLIVSTLLSGCATDFGTKFTEIVTTGIPNPVTSQQIYNIKASYGVALAAAVAYRERPRCTKTALESLSNFCARRSIVVKLQAADLKAQYALNRLETFYSNNPTLDAFDLIQLAKSAVSAFSQLKDNVL